MGLVWSLVLWAVILCALCSGPPMYPIHPSIIKHPTDIWRRIVKESLISIRFFEPPLSLIQHNIPAIDLKLWLERGIMHVKDIITGSAVNTFVEFGKQFGLPNKEFFKYLHFRHFLSSLQWTDNVPISPFKAFFQ